MTKTYVIENDKGVVYGYYSKLWQAKDDIERATRYDETASILCLYGHNFGEGNHMYRIRIDLKTGKFTKQKIRRCV